MMTPQDLIDMTPEQKRAFNRIKRAVADFIAAGGRLYTVTHTVHGMNGEYVQSILSESESGGHIDTQELRIDSFVDHGFSGMADDTHMIEFTDTGRMLITED